MIRGDITHLGWIRSLLYESTSLCCYDPLACPLFSPASGCYVPCLHERVALFFSFPERTSSFFEKTKNGIHHPPHHHIIFLLIYLLQLIGCCLLAKPVKYVAIRTLVLTSCGISIVKTRGDRHDGQRGARCLNFCIRTKETARVSSVSSWGDEGACKRQESEEEI